MTASGRKSQLTIRRVIVQPNGFPRVDREREAFSAMLNPTEFGLKRAIHYNTSMTQDRSGPTPSSPAWSPHGQLLDPPRRHRRGAALCG